MKAIRYTAYGPPEVLRFAEVANPVPGDDEVLVRIQAASVNPLDWHYLRGTPYLVRLLAGWRRPKVTGLGVDVAGTVAAIGRNVTQFRPGDAVFGVCRGAFAEQVCVAEGRLVTKPANLTFAQAAAVPVAAISALQGLRDRGRIQRGWKILINGAAGGVGTFAVQLAREFGAEVTGVCSTRNVELVRSIGAHHVVDYTREDFTRSGPRYDLILDTVGNHALAGLRRALTADGTGVLVGAPDQGRWLGPLAGMLHAALSSRFRRQKLHPFLARLGQPDLIVLQELLQAGKVTPVIDRSYPLGEVPAAIRYLESGHARGKVVITMEAATLAGP
jgi:NADPH:quinone reductase-like Zn-dependent oxidoreductase